MEGKVVLICEEEREGAAAAVFTSEADEKADKGIRPSAQTQMHTPGAPCDSPASVACRMSLVRALICRPRFRDRKTAREGEEQQLRPGSEGGSRRKAHTQTLNTNTYTHTSTRRDTKALEERANGKEM